jgi:hypothetical protein
MRGLRPVKEILIYSVISKGAGRKKKMPLKSNSCYNFSLLEMAWAAREKTRWEGEDLWVVSREGLVAMKSLRGSGQDRDDLKKLKALDDEN